MKQLRHIPVIAFALSLVFLPNPLAAQDVALFEVAEEPETPADEEAGSFFEEEEKYGNERIPLSKLIPKNGSPLQTITPEVVWEMFLEKIGSPGVSSFLELADLLREKNIPEPFRNLIAEEAIVQIRSDDYLQGWLGEEIITFITHAPQPYSGIALDFMIEQEDSFWNLGSLLCEKTNEETYALDPENRARTERALWGFWVALQASGDPPETKSNFVNYVAPNFLRCESSQASREKAAHIILAADSLESTSSLAYVVATAPLPRQRETAWERIMKTLKGEGLRRSEIWATLLHIAVYGEDPYQSRAQDILQRLPEEVFEELRSDQLVEFMRFVR